MVVLYLYCWRLVVSGDAFTCGGMVVYRRQRRCSSCASECGLQCQACGTNVKVSHAVVSAVHRSSSTTPTMRLPPFPLFLMHDWLRLPRKGLLVHDVGVAPVGPCSQQRTGYP